MKRLLFLVFALVLVTACGAVVGCGGGGGGVADEIQNQQGQPQVEEQQSTSTSDESSGGPGDIPVYPGADRIAKVDTEDDSLSVTRTIEQLIYYTDDSAEEVAVFYRDKMKDNGWDETAWAEMQEGYIGSYEKGQYTTATVSITPDVNGKTAITIIWAYPED